MEDDDRSSNERETLSAGGNPGQRNVYRRAGKGSKESDPESDEKKMDDKEHDQPQGFLEIARRWPKQTLCILGNELCERFCYYGMRTVLTLYLMTVLMFSSDTATAVYHAFACVAYTSPILGSIIADGYIGKYWTILSISCLYAFGQALLSFTAIFPPQTFVHPYLDLLSIFLVGLSTGGIKPCVPAFGADQFPKNETRMISLFFGFFYVVTNCGSLVSTFITPIFRVQSCFDAETCFPLAFGVPAALMVVSIVVFITGTPLYIMSPPKENVIASVFYVVFEAIKKKFTSHENVNHWLDHAMEGHNCDSDDRCQDLVRTDQQHSCAMEKLIEDVKALFRVLVLFIPIPMFYALWEQQGSRWIVQATKMDGEVTSWLTIYPDQVHVVNPLMIIILVPVFQMVIYPNLQKIGACPTLLQRIGLGGFLAAVAFIISGFVQLKIDQTMPDTPNATHAFVSIINSFPNSSCNFTVEVDGHETRTIEANSSLTDNKQRGVIQTFRIHEKKKAFMFTSQKPGCPPYFEIEQEFVAGKGYMIVLAPGGWTVINNAFDKTRKGGGQYTLSVIHLIPCEKWPAGGGSNCSAANVFIPPIAICVKSSSGNCKNRNRDFFYWMDNEVTKIAMHDYTTGETVFYGAMLQPKDIHKGKFEIHYLNYTYDGKVAKEERNPLPGMLFSDQKVGGVYALTLTGNDTSYKLLTANVHVIAPENTVSILWQLPAVVVITVAEILLSVSGPEFAYQEASKELKSVVQAVWLLNQSIGNIIILIVAETHFATPAVELFAFGVVMALVMVGFVLLAEFYYTYRADYMRLQQDVISESSLSSTSLSS